MNDFICPNCSGTEYRRDESAVACLAPDCGFEKSQWFEDEEGKETIIRCAICHSTEKNGYACANCDSEMAEIVEIKEENAFTSYKGWANRETWNVALWLGNDEGFYREALRFGNRTLTPGEITARDESETEKFCRNLFGDLTPDGDSLDNVEWEEIVNNIREMCGIEE